MVYFLNDMSGIWTQRFGRILGQYKNSYMNTPITPLLFVLLIFVSCSRNSVQKKDQSDEIVNTWVYQGYDNETDIFTYKSANGLDDNNSGWVFKPNGDMIERTVNSLRATPPVIYANYDNKWTRVKNNLIKVEGTYWGGEKKYSIEVISITSNTLYVKIHN